MMIASIAGMSVNYELSGEPQRPVVVLAHSLGTNLELWSPQVAELRRCFRVLRYDIRGHGRTDATGGDYTVEQLGADLIALLDRLGIERLHFCGVSLGGLIGQWLALNAPERLGRLVLANTAARIANAETWNARIALVRANGVAALADGAIGRWFTSEFIDREPSVADDYRAMLRATSVDGYIGCCVAIREADFRPSAGRIAMPTLVVTGGNDTVTTPSDAAWLAANINDARLVTLPAAHLGNVEARSEFNDVVVSFLTGGNT